MVKATHLLDTATLIWAVHAPEQLSAPARNILRGPESAPAASVVSLMELIIQAQRGKLKLLPDPVQWWNQHMVELDLLVLPIRQSHVEHLWTLPLIHRDPADRLLIAQAIAEGVPLISPDMALRQYAANIVW